MSGDIHLNERQALLSRVLDAVKQCQVRFGGRKELASDGDSRVICLCSTWEIVLQHGMRHTKKALSTLKSVSELTGLSKVPGVSDLKYIETEPAFWQYVREHLSKHDVQRYHMLKNITTDAGRGRAWLRSAFNEHSLERYMHMLLEDHVNIVQYYEDWAFVRDQERSSMLPTMAAGLGSILFAINIDNEDLNSIRQAPQLDLQMNLAYPTREDDDPKPVIATEEAVSNESKRDTKKKKKKFAKVVSFDEAASSSTALSERPKRLLGESSPQSSFESLSSALSADISSLSVSNEPCTDSYRALLLGTVKSEQEPTGMIEMPTNPNVSRNKNGAFSVNLSLDSSEVIKQLEAVKSNAQRPDTIFTSQASDISKSPGSLTEDSASVDWSSASSLPMSPSTPKSNSVFELDVVRPASWGDHRSPSPISKASTDSIQSENSPFAIMYNDTPGTLTPMTPLDHQDMFLDLDTASVDSSSMLNYCPSTENAALALAMAQRGLSESGQGFRTAGDGRQDPSSPDKHMTMSTSELKQAVVAMMLRKDEVEEQNNRWDD